MVVVVKWRYRANGLLNNFFLQADQQSADLLWYLGFKSVTHKE